jgi:predicted DCC family thiol-disulfide oxidoreductase YuxK
VRWILFFDGECALCSASIRWLCRADRQGRISFAPLNGELSRKLGFSHHAARDAGSMVIWREEDALAFTRSDAWIEIARVLGGPWRFFLVVRWIPRRWRDAVYGMIARNRHAFAGGPVACRLPNPELAKRLLE